MGRLPMDSHSQFSYPSPQPQAAYYSCAPPPQLQTQPQQAFIVYPQPQNNVNVAQVPAYQTSSPVAEALPQNQHLAHIVIPTNGSLQSNAPIRKSVQHLPMPSPQMKADPTGSWTTGLFDCMEDPTNALITALFPCVTFGQIADVLDNGHTNCATSGIVYAVAPCFVSGPYRKKLRQRFGLIEAPASDRIIHSMFEPCALCQEYRELNNRGINPALGYHGNLSKQQTATMMVPPRNQMMN
ncbi:hypothetical protein J1N35_026780 [Gossypium stocksii]|uniref:Protein PLANT CADMIUM RESISTANCE 7-like n=1 Tax=Gossypium stocksii TaxID=47602 RepID=A0A9D3V8W9_9ROSI|nr:hypothetical protein J1N35_026780 [Gossypium stocksii]